MGTETCGLSSTHPSGEERKARLLPAGVFPHLVGERDTCGGSEGAPRTRQAQQGPRAALPRRSQGPRGRREERGRWACGEEVDSGVFREMAGGQWPRGWRERQRIQGSHGCRALWEGAGSLTWRRHRGGLEPRLVPGRGWTRPSSPGGAPSEPEARPPGGGGTAEAEGLCLRGVNTFYGLVGRSQQRRKSCKQRKEPAIAGAGSRRSGKDGL